jgi:DNA processing protein
MTAQDDLLYTIALTHVKLIGAVQAKTLVQSFGSAKQVFTAKTRELSQVPGIGAARAEAIKQFENFSHIETKIKFLETHGIQAIYFTDDAYPKRLLHCYDAPLLLYYKGKTDLNNQKVVSIIGTRNSTEYGKQITQQLVEVLAQHQILIASGLAYGIDVAAHKAALQFNTPTVGVLAHGLDSMYPAAHKTIAKQMVENGGLLTEYSPGVIAENYNFPQRNRIVAGMADATIVVETALRGGSMITAEIANNYNKDVFAFPGKTTDAKSQGCNLLIKKNKAILVTEPNDILEQMGWVNKPVRKKITRELFPELTPEESLILQALQQKNTLHIDELYAQTGLHSSTVANAILNMELNNIIQALPGKMYQVLDV